MLVKATEEPPTRSALGTVAGKQQQPRAAIARSQSLESASLSASAEARRVSSARREQEIEYFIPCVLPVRRVNPCLLFRSKPKG